MIALRRLDVAESDAAARQHRTAGALIPGFDVTRHALEETCARYRRVFARGPVWGAFERDLLVGHLALEPGWIEHLRVQPERHGEGIGRLLIELAQGEQDKLRLYTYRADVSARRMYEAAGSEPRNSGSIPNMRSAHPTCAIAGGARPAGKRIGIGRSRYPFVPARCGDAAASR